MVIDLSIINHYHMLDIPRVEIFTFDTISIFYILLMMIIDYDMIKLQLYLFFSMKLDQ
jgi:hypothetical protein